MNIISNFVRNPEIQKFFCACAAGLLAKPAFTYMHECGHAAALKIVWQNAHPKITLHQFGFSGETSGEFTEDPELSSLGRIFGDNASNFMVSAAGAITETTTAIALTALFKAPIVYPFILPTLLLTTIYAMDPLMDPLIDNIPDSYSHDFKDMKDRNLIGYGVITTGIVATTAAVVIKIFSFRNEL